MLLQIDDKIRHFESHEEVIGYLIGDGTINKFDGWTPELLSYEYLSSSNDYLFSQWDRDGQMIALEETVLDDDELKDIAQNHCEMMVKYVENRDPPADFSPVDNDDYRFEVKIRIRDRVNEAAFEATCGTLIDNFIENKQVECHDLIHDLWPEYDPR